MLDGLRKRGFKLTFGEKESGVLTLWLGRGGGYYFGKSKKYNFVDDESHRHASFLPDVGASKAIADGKIKLVNSSPISRIVPNGILLENGTEVPADVIILATG